MKATLYPLLIFGFLFWHPHRSLALDNNQRLFIQYSLQETLQESETVSDNSLSLNALFDDDLLTDDDDDVTISARKKFSFGNTCYVIFAEQTSQNTPSYSDKKIFYSPYFSYLSSSHFIALKVFRL